MCCEVAMEIARVNSRRFVSEQAVIDSSDLHTACVPMTGLLEY